MFKDHNPYDVASSESQDLWLTSYGDLMTILLVFFILLISASKLSAVKFEKIKEAFSPPAEEVKEINLTVLAEMLETKIEEEKLSSLAKIVVDDADIRLVLQDRLLFASGQAQIRAESLPVLRKIVGVFAKIPAYTRISIEGHTDDNPIRTPLFPSNWHLSSARALSVLEVFYDMGLCDEKCELRGYGKYRPIVANRDEKGEAILSNQSANRRVVVRIY